MACQLYSNFELQLSIIYGKYIGVMQTLEFLKYPLEMPCVNNQVPFQGLQ